MGSACCCLQGDQEIDNSLNNENHPSVYRNCNCFNFCIHNFVNVYTSLFHRADSQAAPASVEAAAAARTTTAASTEDDAFSETYGSPPRPLPYHVETRRTERDRLVSRRGNGNGNGNGEGELNKFVNDERLIEGNRNNKASSLKLSTLAEEQKATEVGYFYALTEDEDVCPTCLEEYTPENPKIVTKCSHNFHLGCIYEWMERSDTCPVCCKVMMFDETT